MSAPILLSPFVVISGFVYYTDEKNPKSSVLIDDIHLTRYHNMEKEQELVADTIQKG